MPASAAYAIARETFADYGVDTEAALAALAGIPISMHCWQGDDVGGFEDTRQALGGGLAVTGNYPGKARTIHELRSDIDAALRLIPGKHRLNLHASYGEFGGRAVERNEIEVEHFGGWIQWAKERGLGLDFNPTCFSHPKAADGLTLAHRDGAIREFWIEHCKRARRIGAAMGKALETRCVTNLWIPDGSKDTPADRATPRKRLRESLDAIFREALENNYDAVEPKLFGIGAESYTVGSHEFYLAYAASRQKVFCLDAGHFHPTESVADKLSSLLQFLPRVLLHLSRGVRWDSDHVVTMTDELLAITREVIANNGLDRVHLGLDYFDASINRMAAWVIGMRNVQRALLIALLEPPRIKAAEAEGDYTARLALQEEAKGLPHGIVWDEFCRRQNVPAGAEWLNEVKRYEREVLARRI